MINRQLLPEIEKWLERPEIIAIKGPRQSGKTTILKMLKEKLILRDIPQKNIIELTFEDRNILSSFQKNPKEFIKSFFSQTQAEKYYFLIDEFQYAEEGGQILKLLYDLYACAKFIITGSSSLELASQTGKYLVGRVFSFYLFQFSFGEFISSKSENIFRYFKERNSELWEFIKEGRYPAAVNPPIYSSELPAFFEEYAAYGGYPSVALADTHEAKKMVLKNIYDTYVDKDIVGLLKMGKISGLHVTAELLAGRTGNVVNLHNLAQDAGSYFHKTERHLFILENTYIIRLLRPYFSNKSTELKKSPKIYFVDNGLRNALLNNFNPLSQKPDAGAIVENCVLHQLSAETGTMVFFWRTTGKAEVDFILKTEKGIVPLEVKYSGLEKPEISRSFRSFVNEYKPERAVILTKGFLWRGKINGTEILFAPVWHL